jgi:G3E family GTPase
VLTVVDASNFMTHLQDDALTEVREQVTYADKLLLNKIDQVDAKTIEEVKETIQNMNPFADITCTTHSVAPLDQILDLKVFDADRIEMSIEQADQHHDHDHHDHDHHDHDHHDHDHYDHGHGHHGITSVSVQVAGVLSQQKLSSWLWGVVQAKGADLYRTKGVLAIKNDYSEQLHPQKIAFQVSYE